MNTMLLACNQISEPARRELIRAGCTIHKDVPGVEDDLEIVELRYADENDINCMYIWNVPVEIQIFSKNLHLLYSFDEKVGYKLEGGKLIEPEEPEPEPPAPTYDDLDLGDLEDHPF
jgi:hypothetical protein